MHSSESDWDYSKYLKTSQAIDLPPKAVQYFKTLDSSVSNSKNNKNEGNVVPTMLLESFNLLSKD